MSLGSIAYDFKVSVPEIMSQLLYCTQRDTSEHVIASIYRSLYLCDRKEEYLRHLMRGLFSWSYQVRSVTVGQLEEVCTEENRQRIVNALTDLLKIEETRAVTSRIEEVLKTI